MSLVRGVHAILHRVLLVSPSVNPSVRNLEWKEGGKEGRKERGKEGGKEKGKEVCLHAVVCVKCLSLFILDPANASFDVVKLHKISVIKFSCPLYDATMFLFLHEFE